MSKEKLEAAKEEEKEVTRDNSTRNFLIAIAFVMLLAVAFFVTRNVYISHKYPTVTYNGFTFTKMGPLWYFQWQREGNLYNVPLRYNPQEVIDVPVTGRYDERFQQDSIYITHDPAEGGLAYVALGASELSINLATVMGINITAACTSNTTEACWDRPILTCDNTDKAVIYIREVPETKIVLAGNCVIIQGQGLDMLRAVDKLLYIWYDVIK